MEEKTLSEFLKENGAYESFIENCLNYRHTIEDMSNRSVGIYYGFIWDKTPQGKGYWEDLYNKSLKFDIIYDIDEILYKEYDKKVLLEKESKNKFEKSLKIMKNILQKTSTEEINKIIQEEDAKQEFQTLTLNGIEYHLIPTNISVGHIADYCDKDMKAETAEEYLKRKFEDGNKYEVLFKEKKSSDWSFCYRPNDLTWRKDFDYKLIKKEHKSVIEAYLKDNTLKIEYHHISLQDWVDKWMPYEVDLIENYDEDYCYRIAESKFIIGEKYIHKNGNTYIIKDTCRIQVNDVWIDGVIYVPENEPEQKFVRDSKNFYSSFRKVEPILDSKK